jgi:hypothetical protein
MRSSRVIKHVSENPYLQYFVGMKEYSEQCPFGASTMVEFRRRFSEADIAAILEASIPKAEPSEEDDPANGGTLILNATCCPADIAYPQDLNLLNETREKPEGVIDELCEASELDKPRMYRRQARRDFLKVSKSKKRTAKQMRTALRKQLQYLRRDMGYLVETVREGVNPTQRQKDLLNLLTTVYEQQRLMFETKTHSIPRRIVSLSQPHVRPIPRGKARAKTEFGAKLHISLVDGYARMERLSFEAYNEADDFFRLIEAYRQRYGQYPARILADRIYRNRETLDFCKEKNIRLTGPALGRPPKDPEVTRQARRQEYADICDRNAVEGAFGTMKTAYGLGRVAARLEATSRCVIGVALLVFNLQKRLRAFLLRFLLGLLAMLFAMTRRPNRFYALAE